MSGLLSQAHDISVCGYELDELERCRYRLWKCIHEATKPSSLLTDGFAEAVLKPGIEFEAKVMSRFKWQETAESLQQVMNSGAEMIKHPRLTAVYNYKHIYHRNKVRFKEIIPIKLIGIPDLLIRNPLDRAYYCPVDIKHHGKVTTSDIRRILFYSFILRSQTYRKDKGFMESKARRIHGFVWLPSKPTEEVSEENTKEIIPIPNYSYELNRKFGGFWKSKGFPLPTFDDDYRGYNNRGLHSSSGVWLLSDIRYICRLYGYRLDHPQEITEECSKCKLRKECIKLLTKHGDLSVLRMVGPVRRSMLKACKMGSIRQLYDMTEGQNEKPNVEKLEKALVQRFATTWRRKFNIAGVSLEKIALLAKSLIEDRMLVRKTFEMPVARTELYIDLEYNSFPFCVGVKAVTGDVSRKFQKFIDNKKDVKNVIREAKNLFRNGCVAYVWRGNDAKIMGLTGRSLDVYDVINKYFFMPMKSYNVKDVAKYLGHIPPELEIMNGLHCLVKFNRYLMEKEGPLNQQIREEILKYNWNDVESLHFIVREVKKLSTPHYSV
jgi:predicted RecB family nuclease